MTLRLASRTAVCIETVKFNKLFDDIKQHVGYGDKQFYRRGS